MKRNRFNEEQVIGILRESLCAKHNISEQTYYGWKRKYGALHEELGLRQDYIAEHQSPAH